MWRVACGFEPAPRVCGARRSAVASLRCCRFPALPFVLLPSLPRAAASPAQVEQAAATLPPPRSARRRSHARTYLELYLSRRGLALALGQRARPMTPGAPAVGLVERLAGAEGSTARPSGRPPGVCAALGGLIVPKSAGVRIRSHRNRGEHTISCGCVRLVRPADTIDRRSGRPCDGWRGEDAGATIDPAEKTLPHPPGQSCVTPH